MDDFNNSKTPCGAKGFLGGVLFDMWGFYRLKKKEISDRRRADDQLIMKPFFFFAWRKKCFYLWGWVKVTTPPYLSIRTWAGFFRKGLIIIFLVYVELLVSWFLGKSGRSFHLSLSFGCGSISDSSRVQRHFTSLLGFCFCFNSHEVYSAINGTFLSHDFDILMHYFVLSFKKINM